MSKIKNGIVTDDLGHMTRYKDGERCWKLYKGGTKVWYKNGLIHRLNGPAVIFANSPNDAWFMNGRRIFSYKELQKLTGHSDAYIMYLKLKWGEMNV